MADESNSGVMTDVEALPFPEEDLAAMLDGEKKVPETVDQDQQAADADGDQDGSPDGDTTDTTEDGGPDESGSSEDESQGSEDDGAAEKVILAKDGTHTIPYDELVTARAQAKEAKELAEQWKKLAEERGGESAGEGASDKETASDGDADGDGPTDENEADSLFTEEAFEDLLDDYPEAAQQIKAIMDTTSTLQQKLREMEQVVQKTALNSAIEQHFSEIATAHDDYDKILPSEEMKSWIKGQPDFIRAELERVYDSGTSSEVADLITAYKDQTGYKGSATTTNHQQGGKEGNSSTSKGPSLPESLGDSPGAAGPADAAEAFLQLSPASQLDKLENMSPDKREALLAKIM
jgi:hypothetical protein